MGAALSKEHHKRLESSFVSAEVVNILETDESAVAGNAVTYKEVTIVHAPTAVVQGCRTKSVQTYLNPHTVRDHDNIGFFSLYQNLEKLGDSGFDLIDGFAPRGTPCFVEFLHVVVKFQDWPVLLVKGDKNDTWISDMNQEARKDSLL